jgi:hypothetical protein
MRRSANLSGTEPKIHHLDTVAGLLPRLEPDRRCTPRTVGVQKGCGTTQTKECQRVLEIVILM